MKLLAELDYISVAETKAKLSEKLKSVELKGRKYAVTSHGKPVAVLVNYQEYLSLREILSDKKQVAQYSFQQLTEKVREQKAVIESITALFDEKKLTRKGQKRYKNEAVKKTRKP